MTAGHSNSLLCYNVYSKIVDEMNRSYANEENKWQLKNRCNFPSAILSHEKIVCK
jgi:hypothetical protein